MCLMWLIVGCLPGLMPCTRKPCGGRAFGVRPSPLPPYFLLLVVFCRVWWWRVWLRFVAG